MLTLFTTAKPFLDHIKVIQLNALRSWQQLHPEVEILLFGDEACAADVCNELSIRHIPEVRKNSHGTKYLSSMYDQAQELARHEILCHVNCDILLLDDFYQAFETVSHGTSRFLMAGHRWDVDIRKPLDFSAADWRNRVRDLAQVAGRQRPAQWIDYFVFPRGLFYKKIPEFVIGRPGWDNWLLWYARASGARVVDASSIVCAVHQNHDYSYHPEGEKGVWEGEEAQQNYRLLEGHRKFGTLENATHVLLGNGLHRNYRHWYVQARRISYDFLSSAWFGFLNLTRPLRRRMGLRQKSDRSV
jgi:hypothetical protein